MKCIYCNAENHLTSSDIITYAITGAKLTKTFVCKEHNGFTNDMYEKKFVDDMNFFRNSLGLLTRDGNSIQYTADVSINGKKIHNVKLSTKESLFAPKNVVSGYDEEGEKVLLAPMEKLEAISKGNATPVDISTVTLHKEITADNFFGYYAVHTVAKIAYEWYCYVNNIEEYTEECKEIVDYILGKNNEELVDIIVDPCYYNIVIEQLSEIGTNALFQYDEIDGCRYVIFDLWKTIAYRVKIGKTPDDVLQKGTDNSSYKLYLYRIDGSSTKTVFRRVICDGSKIRCFTAMKPQDIDQKLWRFFIERLVKITSTMILSIRILKQEVDLLVGKIKKYDAGEIGVAHLLGFEEDNVLSTIQVISQLYYNKDEYDMAKPFNQNLSKILQLQDDTFIRTREDKIDFLNLLKEKDEEKQLSEYIWNGINTFYEIYENEERLFMH